MTATGHLVSGLGDIRAEVSAYLTQLMETDYEDLDSWHPTLPNHYWKQVPSDLQRRADDITARLLELAKALVVTCKRSLLVDAADIRDLQVAVKTIRSALHLRRYVYSEGEAIHDEGLVLGYSPASQDEQALKPSDASPLVEYNLSTIERILALTDEHDKGDVAARDSIGQTYRRDTAFIMMWMDPREPDLEDIRDTLRDVFVSFGIKAIRADDVEHEGIITDRIINEIRSSEFLLADLTGARPSVYYEVGFAHALGKRVILYRKEGTEIHFDLAGYNCPEYRNNRDLREKLTKRLEQLTNRKPKD